jgi:hypothetical protein
MGEKLRFKRMTTRDISITDAAVDADQQALQQAIDLYEALQKVRKAGYAEANGEASHVNVSIRGINRGCIVDFVGTHATGDSTVLLYSPSERAYVLAQQESSGLYTFVQAYAREVGRMDDDDTPPWKVIGTLAKLLYQD